MFEILIREFNTSKVVRRLKASSEREAERIERGANINLDHKNFYTEIVSLEGNNQEK